jgi:hypothetical protein
LKRILLLLPLVLAACSTRTESTSIFYVSTVGQDDWSGRAAEPNTAKTDGPFRTLERARQAVRSFLSSSEASAVSVFVRGGIYRIPETLTFGQEDSGSKDRPVHWKACGSERVVFAGDLPIAGFKPVRDPALRKRCSEPARDKIVFVDLPSQSITNFGDITPRGSPGLEVFFRGERMPLSSYPNEGWLRIADVPQNGPRLFHDGLAREKRYDNVPVGRHFGRIAYEGNRPDSWADSPDIYLHGYWTWDWSDSFQRVLSIDRARHEITLAEPHHGYGYTKNQRYRVLNVLEEIDRPGEWCLDRATGRLYFWPPETPAGGDITVSMLAGPFFLLTDCSDISIEGIVFANARSGGVSIRGGERDLIAGCTFVNLGGTAVVIEGGAGTGVLSCDISDVAMDGIRLGGGDRATLTPAGNFATNNHIHHYSRWVRTGQYAISISGVGNHIDHNLIHDAPHEALLVTGNEHVVEYNEVFGVCGETGDAGALHTGRNWTWRGNVIRHNYFHDLRGPGLHGVMAVYLDDWASGFTVYGNVFVWAGRSVLIGGGRDNVVENNVFVAGSPAIHVDARGLGWAKYYFDGTTPSLFQGYDEVNASAPPYATKYPELKTLREDEPALPKHNVIVRNVSFGGRWLDIYDANVFDFSIVTMKDNVIADPVLCRRLRPGHLGWDPYYLNIDLQDGYESFLNADPRIRTEFAGNVFCEGDPGFVGAAGGDFRLKKEAPAWVLGFHPIPFEKIGLFTDAYRRTKAASASSRGQCP